MKERLDCIDERIDHLIGIICCVVINIVIDLLKHKLNKEEFSIMHIHVSFFSHFFLSLREIFDII